MSFLRSHVIVCALLFLNLYPASGPDRQKFFDYFFSNIAVDLYDQYQLFNLLHILIILTKKTFRIPFNVLLSFSWSVIKNRLTKVFVNI